MYVYGICINTIYVYTYRQGYIIHMYVYLYVIYRYSIKLVAHAVIVTFGSSLGRPPNPPN